MRAPFDGTISARYLDEGVVVSPGAKVLRITEDSQLEAVVGIPPKSLNSVRKMMAEGEKIDCWVEGIQAQCTVGRILPETDERTRLIPVVFEIHGKFNPGQIVRIQIKETLPIEGFWVPTSALLPGARGMWSLFVVDKQEDGDHAKLHAVTIKFNDGDFALIDEDKSFDGKKIILNDENKPTGDTGQGKKDKEKFFKGKQIVADGTQRVTQGQRVKVIKTSELNRN